MSNRSLICGVVLGAFLFAGTLSYAQKDNMGEQWGIQPKSLHLSAAGNLIDLRYKVVNPEKAASLFKDEKVHPYLLDQASQARLPVPDLPKIGAFRTSPKNMIAGKINFIMFSNPGGLLKSGSKVTLVIGDFKAENLTVE